MINLFNKTTTFIFEIAVLKGNVDKINHSGTTIFQSKGSTDKSIKKVEIFLGRTVL